MTMTREEEIRQAAATYILEMYGEINEDSDVSEGFREGAKWADENPNSNGKELLYVAQKTAERTKKEFISKACDWLNNELFEDKVYFINPYYDTDVKSKSYDTLEQFMENFKKAMEL